VSGGGQPFYNCGRGAAKAQEVVPDWSTSNFQVTAAVLRIRVYSYWFHPTAVAPDWSSSNFQVTAAVL